MAKYAIDAHISVVTLGNGVEVKCRSVPPFTTGTVLESVPEPEYPYVSIKSAAGGEERRPALRETPEYDQWQAEMIAHRKKLTKAMLDHQLGYGIVSWKFPGMDAFVGMPPDEWVVPAYFLEHYGIVTSEDPFEYRLQFIKFALIQTDNDQRLVDRAIGAETRPLTEQEIQSAIRPFGSSAGTEQPASQ